jgi:hypothetical protein
MIILEMFGFEVGLPVGRLRDMVEDTKEKVAIFKLMTLERLQECEVQM